MPTKSSDDLAEEDIVPQQPVNDLQEPTETQEDEPENNSSPPNPPQTEMAGTSEQVEEEAEGEEGTAEDKPVENTGEAEVTEEEPIEEKSIEDKLTEDNGSAAGEKLQNEDNANGGEAEQPTSGADQQDTSDTQGETSEQNTDEEIVGGEVKEEIQQGSLNDNENNASDEIKAIVPETSDTN